MDQRPQRLGAERERADRREAREPIGGQGLVEPNAIESSLFGRGSTATRLTAVLLTICLAATICPAVAGCQKSGIEMVPVSGRVTYGGGDWPAAGSIVFLPQRVAGEKPLLPGSSQFEKDGKYSARTASRAGLAPGSYAVRIECWETPPRMDSPSSGKSWIDKEFQTGPQPDFELEVPAGSGPLTVNIDIPTRK